MVHFFKELILLCLDKMKNIALMHSIFAKENIDIPKLTIRIIINIKKTK